MLYRARRKSRVEIYCKDCIMGCIDKGCIEGVSRGASRVSMGCVEPLDADAQSAHSVSIEGRIVVSSRQENSAYLERRLPLPQEAP